MTKRQDFPSLVLLKPSPAVRDYKSQLVIIRDGQQVSQATIEVNKPLHYGGYHFYQSSYDQQGHEYTVLEVVSDSGLSAFYAGVVLVGVGCVWRFWVSPVIKKLRRARI